MLSNVHLFDPSLWNIDLTHTYTDTPTTNTHTLLSWNGSMFCVLHWEAIVLGCWVGPWHLPDSRLLTCQSATEQDRQ